MPSSRRKQPALLAPSTTRLLEPEGWVRPSSPGGALGWILEAFEGDAAYSHRRMFGCEAGYLDGRIYFVTATKREPWNGLLICTSLERQPMLRAEWPALSPHRVLGKWLYVSQVHPDFESIARALIRAALARDPRLGVIPKIRKRKRKQTAESPAAARRRGRTPHQPRPAPVKRKGSSGRIRAARERGARPPRSR